MNISAVRRDSEVFYVLAYDKPTKLITCLSESGKKFTFREEHVCKLTEYDAMPSWAPEYLEFKVTFNDGSRILDYIENGVWQHSKYPSAIKTWQILPFPI